MAIADRLESKFAVNPFGNQIGVERKPESIEDVTLEISEKVNSMFEEYKKAFSFYLKNYNNIFEYFSSFKLEVLSPIEIDLVLQLIAKTNLCLESIVAGYMISRLINDSYNAGNNHFNIITNDKIINNLFSNVHGTKENPMIATVFGNAGGSFGLMSKHCSYTLIGNTGPYCGIKSEKCTYNITGNAGQICGYRSKDCTYNIMGKIKPNSTEVNDSIFKVHDQESYNLLCKTLNSSNKIQLLNLNENVIVETKK